MDLSERNGGIARRHPWEVARERFITGHCLPTAGLERPIRALDVGAGDAWLAHRMIEHLPPGSSVVAWDVNYGPADLEVLSGDARIELVRTRPAGRFDLLLLFDVLEHVADDADFLGSLVRDNVTSDGRVLVTVPAWPALYSRHDEALGHHRRYRPTQIRRLLEGAGLEIVAGGGLFHGLVAPRYLRKLRERWRRAGEPPNLSRWDHGPVMTAMVERGLVYDGLLSRLAAAARVELPGASWWAVCRKP